MSSNLPAEGKRRVAQTFVMGYYGCKSMEEKHLRTLWLVIGLLMAAALIWLTPAALAGRRVLASDRRPAIWLSGRLYQHL